MEITKIICDMCGKEMSVIEGRNRLKIEKPVKILFYSTSICTRNYEICIDCLKTVNGFIDERVKKVQAENSEKSK